MASWLVALQRAAGICRDALLAGSVSTREPWQLFEELTALITKEEPDFATGLAQLDEKLGSRVRPNLTSGVGTEAALAVTGLSTSRTDMDVGNRRKQPVAHRQLRREAGRSV